MKFSFFGTNYEISLNATDNGITVEGGCFGEVELLGAPLFTLDLKDMQSGEHVPLTSAEGWERVSVLRGGTELMLHNPLGYSGLSVAVEAKANADSVCWSTEVINDCAGVSVMEISYPAPQTKADGLKFLAPMDCGRVYEASEKFFGDSIYPNSHACMQFFAAYGKHNGVYIGIEDGTAASKRFKYSGGDNVCGLEVGFFGIGAGLPANSFKLAGKARWQYLKGDWYDASQIYAKFVKSQANWLPEIGEQGRKDTPKRFKDVPFWISDYIPNSPYQRDNKPMNLSAGSDSHEPDYWWKAPIELQKQLGVPIAYHVYNWHEIPFNIEYPHFLPAKAEFIEGAKKLREHDIYVLPYINGVCWEMNDDEGDHEVTFNNTGCRGALMNEDGSFVVENYPQTTKSGITSHLVPNCGSSRAWHKIIEELTREMEKTLPIDGIYYDQISATSGSPCYNPDHPHLPGGGSVWVDGYNSMMRKIRADKPDDSFYFSECNAEPFMKTLDGYLTWMWVYSGEVPAFPAVYAGYIEMIGCCTIGNKKDDFEFFKYCTAKSLLYGVQLGWCKADIIFSPKHMEFIKKAVDARRRYSELFHSAYMLRPPVVKTNLDKMVTTSGLWFKGEIVAQRVQSGAWRTRKGDKTVLFVINCAESDAEYAVEFDADEYGVSCAVLPPEFKLKDGICTVSGRLGKYEIKTWDIYTEGENADV